LGKAAYGLGAAGLYGRDAEGPPSKCNVALSLRIMGRTAF
jgi:hypothetical protein